MTRLEVTAFAACLALLGASAAPQLICDRPDQKTADRGTHGIVAPDGLVWILAEGGVGP
jgi:hypothetical protein